MATHFDRLQHPRGMSKDVCGCTILSFYYFPNKAMRPPFPPPLLLFVGYHNNFSLNIYMLICASSLSAHPRYLFIIFFLSYLFGLIISPILKIHPFFLPYLFVLSHHWNSFTKYEQIFCRVCFFSLADSSGKQTNRLTESAKIEFYFLFWGDFFVVVRSEIVVTFDRFPCIQDIKVVRNTHLPSLNFFFLDVRLFFFFFFSPSLSSGVYTWWLDSVMGVVLCCYFLSAFIFFPLRGIIFTFFI